jgi:hypothetical protein
VTEDAAIAARIAALEDIDAIEAIKLAYWRAIDRKTPDALLQILAEDVTIDFQGMPPCPDRASFMAAIRPEAARTDTFHMHHGKNPQVELAGPDTATATWDIFYSGTDTTARTLVQMAGEYHDRYERRAGWWWITAMTMRQTSLTVQTINADGEATYAVLGETA